MNSLLTAISLILFLSFLSDAHEGWKRGLVNGDLSEIHLPENSHSEMTTFDPVTTIRPADSWEILTASQNPEETGISQFVSPNEPRKKPASSLMRSQSISALHENDMKVVQQFKKQLNSVLPKLLSYAGSQQPEGSRQSAFSENVLEIENTMMELGADYAHLISAGNLFRSEIAEDYDIARSLYELLQYHESLELRYGNENSVSYTLNTKNGETVSGTPDIGAFGLKLVEYELSLLSFFRGDGSFHTDTDDYMARLFTAENRFQNLMSEYEQMVGKDTPYSVLFEKEIERLVGVFHQLQNVPEMQNQSSVPKTDISDSSGTAIENIVFHPKQYENDMELTKPQIEELLTLLDQKIKIMELIIEAQREGKGFDLAGYVGRKEEIYQIKNILKRIKMSNKDEWENIQVFLMEVVSKVLAMDDEIDCESRKDHPNEDYRAASCLPFSFDKYQCQIKALAHKVDTLMHDLGNWESMPGDFNVANTKSDIEASKLRLEALQNINTSIWANFSELAETKNLFKIIADNLANSEVILANPHSRASSSLLDSNASICGNTKKHTCVENVSVVIENEFRSIEHTLRHYSKPKAMAGENIADIQRRVETERSLFEDIMRNSGPTIINCSENLKLKAEKISSLLTLLEESLKKQQND